MCLSVDVLSFGYLQFQFNLHCFYAYFLLFSYHADVFKHDTDTLFHVSCDLRFSHLGLYLSKPIYLMATLI